MASESTCTGALPLVLAEVAAAFATSSARLDAISLSFLPARRAVRKE